MTVAAVYLRVSTSDDTDDESLTQETPRQRIAGLCKARVGEYGPEYIGGVLGYYSADVLTGGVDAIHG